MPESALAVRLDDLVAGLSAALDLVEGEPLGHAGRSALIALRLADRLGLTGTERDVVLYSALLKDAGCSSNAARITELLGVDDREFKAGRARVSRGQTFAFARYVLRHTGSSRRALRMLAHLPQEARAVADLRCHAGAQVIGELDLPEPRPVASVLVALDERFDGKGRPSGLAGEQIPLAARIVQVAQTAEVWVTTFGVSRARQELEQRAGRMLDPDLVRAVAPMLGDTLEEEPAWRVALRAQADDTRVLMLDPPGVERVAAVFAGIVDRKSPYTARHSKRVAELCDALAARMNVGDEERRALRCAALLHDIGKLGVPNTILDAPRELTAWEWSQMRSHPELTHRILGEVAALRDADRIAAAHHERLDGSGYPHGLAGDQLSLGVRVIGVADTFEALTARRPYREPAAPADALGRIRAETPARYDQDVVDALGDLVASDAEPT